MANDTDKALTKKEAAKGDLVIKDPAAEQAHFFKTVGFDPDDIKGFQRTSTGGATKWVNMRSFQADANVPQNKPVKGNGGGFAGTLVGKGEMEVDEEEGGEEVVNPETGEVKRLRYFYSLRLVTPCPVTWKNDEGLDEEGMSQPGEVVCIGERFAFRKWRQLVEDGGEYIVAVQPDSRRKIKGGKRTMWTFNVWEKTIRPALKVKAELMPVNAHK